MTYKYIPYVNTSKSAPKARKILVFFITFEKKPPLFLGVWKQGGGFSRNTTAPREIDLGKSNV